MRAKAAGPFRGRAPPVAHLPAVPWRSSELEVDEGRAAVAPNGFDQQQRQAGENADGPRGNAMVDAVQLLEQARARELDEQPECDQGTEKRRQQGRRLRPIGEANQEVGGSGRVVRTEEDPAQADEVEGEGDSESSAPERASA